LKSVKSAKNTISKLKDYAKKFHFLQQRRSAICPTFWGENFDLTS